MSDRRRRFLNVVLYAGLRKEEYLHVSGRINKRNLRALEVSSCLGGILLAILFITACFKDTIADNRVLYGVFLIIMVVIYVISKFVLKKSSHWVLPVFYVFLAAAFAFGLVLGVFFSPNVPATTFCVLLFALPLLIIDKPYRAGGFLALVSIAFCIFSTQIKPADIASLDRTNAISFLFLAITINTLMMTTKARESLNSAHIERERDTDDLTRLMTKAASIREINQYLNDGIERAALLVLDIDNFKSVNDTMGHAYGDTVIRIMGKCIKYAFRQSDIMSRFGGDEFVIFLPGAKDDHAITSRVDALVDRMNEELSTGDNVITVTGSIGIAVYPDDAKTYDDLFKKADEALYESKKKGKNCYTFYIDRNLEGNNK